jgi:hypothetical protein
VNSSLPFPLLFMRDSMRIPMRSEVSLRVSMLVEVSLRVSMLVEVILSVLV